MSSSSKAHLYLLRRQLGNSRECRPRKEFLRICWIGQDDAEALSRREREHLQNHCSYIEWLLNVSGVTHLNEPRASTPESCSDLQEDSACTCPSPSIDTSILAQDTSCKTITSLCSSMQFEAHAVLSQSPTPWKSGRTPSPVDAPRRCRGFIKTGSENARLTSRPWNPSPMLWYYIWEQQRSNRPASYLSPRRVQQWLQDHANLGDLASAIVGVELVLG